MPETYPKEILPFEQPKERIPHARAFRSTWIISSVRSLQERGHYDRYLELLSAEHHDAVLLSVAGVWLPMAVARAHYEACQRLELSKDEQTAMGLAVGDRGQGSLLSTVVMAARGAGVTPWTILPQFQRLWLRGANGGAMSVTALGPKEAKVETVGCELFDIDYFRVAFGGVLFGIMRRFAQKAYYHEVPGRLRHGSLYRFQWV
jgi:hypothetical protein